MKSVSKSVLGLVLGLASFGAGISTPARADVILRFENGQLGVVYREAALVVYKLCVPGTSVATRACAAPQIEKSMDFTAYTTTLQRLFGVQEQIYRGVDALQRIRVEIAFIEGRTVDTSLSPDEVTNAHARLVELVDLELKLIAADAILKFLEPGQNVTYTASIATFFRQIPAPFGDWDLYERLRDAIKDPNNGVIWVNLGAMCWSDAAGLRPERQCLQQRGCKLALSSAWDLPAPDQLDSLDRTSDVARYCMWMRDGGSHPLRSGCWEDRRLTFCTAPAAVVDPTGDIDGDGIKNREDHCNQTPDDLTAPIHRDEPYKGCAGGQIPNN